MIHNKCKTPIYKIAVVGDSGVGKSNIVSRYVYDEFKFGTKTTIGVNFNFKDAEVNGSKFGLYIWDTAGQEKFKALSKSVFS